MHLLAPAILDIKLSWHELGPELTQVCFSLDILDFTGAK